MLNYANHDQIIAKIQHFADSLHQVKLEKEALALIIDSDKKDLQNQILIYEEIINEYHDTFKEILYR